jgi:hypothetical protein
MEGKTTQNPNRKKGKGKRNLYKYRWSEEGSGSTPRGLRGAVLSGSHVEIHVVVAHEEQMS